MAKVAGGSGSGSGRFKMVNKERSRLKAEEEDYYQRTYRTSKKGYQNAINAMNRANAKALKK